MENSLERLIRVTDKRIADLFARTTAGDARIKELSTVLKQLQTELKEEQKFVATAIRASESSSKVLMYDNEAYWENMEQRYAQLQDDIDECQAELAEVQEEIEKEYQLQQQYQILLDQHLEKQIFKIKKEEQAELDEYAVKLLSNGK